MTHLSTTKKILLGILTFIPIVLLIFYFVFFFSMFFGVFNDMGTGDFRDGRPPFGNPDDFSSGFIWVFIIIFTMVIVNLGLLIFYIINILKNPKFQKDSNMKIIWVLLMIFGSLVGTIIYYFMEIYPLPNEKPILLND